jgi:hypothetical protein
MAGATRYPKFVIGHEKHVRPAAGFDAPTAAKAVRATR